MDYPKEFLLKMVKHYEPPKAKEPKAPKPRKKVICKKHFKGEVKHYGNAPCAKCLLGLKNFYLRAEIADRLIDADYFCEKTGARLIGFDPDFLFGFKDDYKNFDLSPTALGAIAAALRN